MIKRLEPVPNIFEQDMLKLHVLYLEKLEHLSKGEREAFENYFTFMAAPYFIIDKNIDIERIKNDQR